MSWPGAIFLGLLTGVLGGFYSGFMAELAVPWLRISRFEGNAAFFVLYMALLGFVVSTVVGIAVCRLAGTGGTLRGFGGAVLVVFGLVSVAGALAWAQREETPLLAVGGFARALDLAVEVRLPAGLRPAPHRDGAAYVDLQSGRSVAGGMLRLDEARQEDGRWIVPATVEIPSAASGRILSVRQPQQATQYFPADIPARPAALDAAWRAWLEPSSGAPPDRAFGLRYRIVTREAPSPDARRRQALAALPPDAPPEALLPFLSALREDVAREEAIRRLLERPDSDAVLLAWMRGPDQAAARDAMFIAGSLYPATPAYAEAVLARADEVARIAASIEPGPASAAMLQERAGMLVDGIVAAAGGLLHREGDLRPGLRAMAEAVRPRETAAPRALTEAIDAVLAQLDAMAR